MTKFVALFSLATLSFMVNRSAARAHDDARPAAVETPRPAAAPVAPAAAAPGEASASGEAAPLSACTNCHTHYQACLVNCDSETCACLCFNQLCACEAGSCATHCAQKLCPPDEP